MVVKIISIKRPVGKASDPTICNTHTDPLVGFRQILIIMRSERKFLPV